jgi:poly-gamma-glutamate synthesis protein (capsule biosynthesis protein)
VLKYGKFDVVTLANNHILDQSETGLIDTIELCKNNNIRTVGAGRNLLEASEPLVIEENGLKIAIVNICENEFSIAHGDHAGANPLDIISNYYQIEKLKEVTTRIIVILHGGNEYYELPSPRMVKTCRFFARIGASAVICHHTHSPSGYEIYNGVPIFYSLGNFIFDWKLKQPQTWYEGYLIKFELSEKSVKDFELIPYKQCLNSDGLRLLDDSDKSEFLKKIEDLSIIISQTELLQSRWEKFCMERKRDYNISLLPNNILRYLYYKKLLPQNMLFVDRSNLKNLIRCESHRDVLLTNLE